MKFWEQQEAEDSLLSLSISDLLIGLYSIYLPLILLPAYVTSPPSVGPLATCSTLSGSPPEPDQQSKRGRYFFKYSCSVGGGEGAEPDPLTDDVIASRKKLMKPSQANLHPQVFKLHLSIGKNQSEIPSC